MICFRALRSALAPESALAAAAIGYFTLFSLFPLTLMTVAIASYWVDPSWAESEIVQQLEFAIPALGELLGANIHGIIRNRGTVTGFALIILLWSGSNIFAVLTREMDKVWHVATDRPMWRRRGIAMLMALSLSFLLLALSFLEGTVFTIVNSLIPDELDKFRPYTSQLWSVFVDIGLFLVLYGWIPHISLSWKQVLPGAIAAGLLWELAKRGFLLIIEIYLSRSNLVYGSVSIIIVLLTWTYVSALIFFFGGYLNYEYAQSKAQDARQKANRTIWKV